MCAYVHTHTCHSENAKQERLRVWYYILALQERDGAVWARRELDFSREDFRAFMRLYLNSEEQVLPGLAYSTCRVHNIYARILFKRDVVFSISTLEIRDLARKA